MAFDPVPIKMVDPLEWCRRIAYKSNELLNGKSNNIGSITLTANQATTTVTEAAGRIGEDTVVLFMPTTANAAAEIGAGGIYVSGRSVANKTFTITHANNAQTDRAFNYVLIG